MIAGRRRCLLAGIFEEKNRQALRRPVPCGAYGQSARGGPHAKTLARGSAILAHAKRPGVRPALRRF